MLNYILNYIFLFSAYDQEIMQMVDFMSPMGQPEGTNLRIIDRNKMDLKFHYAAIKWKLNNTLFHNN